MPPVLQPPTLQASPSQSRGLVGSLMDFDAAGLDAKPAAQGEVTPQPGQPVRALHWRHAVGLSALAHAVPMAGLIVAAALGIIFWHSPTTPIKPTTKDLVFTLVPPHTPVQKPLALPTHVSTQAARAGGLHQRNQPVQLTRHIITPLKHGVGTPIKPLASQNGMGRTAQTPASVDATAEQKVAPYVAELQKRIRSTWHPPRGIESKQVVVAFEVSKDGNLHTVEVTQSSGEPTTDAAAVEAVQQVFPFRPLPDAFNGENILIEYTFDYSVFGDEPRNG